MSNYATNPGNNISTFSFTYGVMENIEQTRIRRRAAAGKAPFLDCLDVDAPVVFRLVDHPSPEKQYVHALRILDGQEHNPIPIGIGNRTREGLIAQLTECIPPMQDVIFI